MWEGIYVLTVEIGNRGATGIELERIIREIENDVEKGIHQARNRPFEKKETHNVDRGTTANEISYHRE